MDTKEHNPPPSEAAGEESLSTRRRIHLPVPFLTRIAPAVAALLLGISILLPYWSMTLHAPQYPEGLEAVIFTGHLSGDVDEIDELNHYIGMMRLGDAGRIERGLSSMALSFLVILGLAAAVVPSRWAGIIALPIAVFPIAFVADLAFWLDRAGHDLDPHAALSSSVQPFTPHLLGVGEVGQFSTAAQFEVGFYLSLIAAVLVVAGAIFRLRRGDR